MVQDLQAAVEYHVFHSVGFCIVDSVVKIFISVKLGCFLQKITSLGTTMWLTVPPASGAPVIARDVSHRPRWASVAPAGQSLRTWRPSCTGRRTPDCHCSSSAALAASDGPACCSCTDTQRVSSLLTPVKKRGDKSLSLNLLDVLKISVSWKRSQTVLTPPRRLALVWLISFVLKTHLRNR